MWRRWSMGLMLVLMTTAARGDEFPPELVHWTPLVDRPVFAGEGGDAWDAKIRERGFILVEDGTYHLWYTGYNEAKAPRTMSLGHATSPDGLKWTRDPANPIFAKAWTEDVCLLKRDGKYVMFAEGVNDVSHQLVSTDRVHWDDQGSIDVRKVDGTPIPPGPYGTPTIWFEDGVWYFFYERGDLGIWLATSTDRKVFRNVQDDPVIGLGPSDYDKGAVALNQIVKRIGWYYGFYHANRERPWKDWTSCIARSRDLVHWEKFPGNPIVKDNCSSPILVTAPDGDRLYTMHPAVRVFKPLKAK